MLKTKNDFLCGGLNSRQQRHNRLKPQGDDNNEVMLQILTFQVQSFKHRYTISAYLVKSIILTASTTVFRLSVTILLLKTVQLRWNLNYMECHILHKCSRIKWQWKSFAQFVVAKQNSGKKRKNPNFGQSQHSKVFLIFNMSWNITFSGLQMMPNLFLWIYLLYQAVLVWKQNKIKWRPNPRWPPNQILL
jgi:hypothetical protein